jgi:outer membrane protein
MKNITKLAALLSFCMFMAFSVNAQKMAHVDGDAIIPNMPAYKRAQAEVESYGKILQKQLEGKQAEMQKYYADVMAQVQAGTMAPAQQKEAEAKLMKMQEDLQKAAAKADQDLVKKEQDLIKPLYEQFNNALEAVAKENGYGYIIDKKLILYSDGGIDATSKVKAKLGVQ